MNIHTIIDSKKILIVTPDKLNVDEIAACWVLQDALINKNIETTLLTHVKNYSDNFEDNFPRGEKKIERKIVSKCFEAKLPKNREIEDVKVIKDGDEFKFEVITKSGNVLNPVLNLTREKERFDVIILLGFSALENSREFIDGFGSLISKSPTILVGYTDFDVKTDLKYIKPVGSISEVILALLDELGIKLNEKYATQILTGILSNTHNLKINTDKSTLAKVNTLINTHGANMKWANEIANSELTPDQFNWQKKVLDNVKIIDFFAYSYVDDPSISSSILGGLSNDQKVPFINLKGIKVGLTLTKLNKTIHGFVEVKGGDISALTLTNNYPRLGDAQFVYFWTPEGVGSIIKNFQRVLKIDHHEHKVEIIRTADAPEEEKVVVVKDVKTEPSFTPTITTTKDTLTHIETVVKNPVANTEEDKPIQKEVKVEEVKKEDIKPTEPVIKVETIKEAEKTLEAKQGENKTDIDSKILEITPIQSTVVNEVKIETKQPITEVTEKIKEVEKETDKKTNIDSTVLDNTRLVQPISEEVKTENIKQAVKVQQDPLVPATSVTEEEISEEPNSDESIPQINIDEEKDEYGKTSNPSDPDILNNIAGEVPAVPYDPLPEAKFN